MASKLPQKTMEESQAAQKITEGKSSNDGST